MSEKQVLPAVAERILDLVDRFGGLARPGARPQLVHGLVTLISHDPALLAFTPIYLIEPGSGLRFYPISTSRVGWKAYTSGQRSRRHFRGRDPLGYICREYAAYIQAGLLYSGHIKLADRDLYNALWSQKELQQGGRKVEDHLRAAGILTAADLADPAPGMEARAETIRQIDLALAKQRLVQKYLLVAQKRMGKGDRARDPALIPTPL